jgi:hypothetical protein
MLLRRRLVVVGAGTALGLLALAASAESARAPKAFTVQLLSRNDSTMTGTARFVPRGKKSFVVIVRVQGGPPGGPDGYMAHIHTGPCSIEPTFERPRIAYGLNNVKRGFSRTTTRHSLARYRRGKYSLNVHEPTEPFRPIACGDLPRRF